MKQRTIFIAAIVLLAAAFGGATMYIKNMRAQQAQEAAARNREALVRFHSPTMGDANAPVHIVEFLDPACETCAAFYPFVKDIMAKNPGKIRLTVRYAPFHRGSDEVVKALEAARRQGKYWESLEALLSTQHVWTEHHTAIVDRVWQPLSNVGVNIERAQNEMQLPDIDRALQQDMADVRALNVTKTPEFFVNGRPLPKFGDEELLELIEEELAAAKHGKK